MMKWQSQGCQAEEFPLLALVKLLPLLVVPLLQLLPEVSVLLDPPEVVEPWEEVLWWLLLDALLEALGAGL
jgi:hypothetical protein